MSRHTLPFPPIFKTDMPEVQVLVDLLKVDKEAFRIQAIEAYSAFSPKDRATCRILTSKNTSAYDVLTVWEETLQPAREALEANFSKPAFRKSLAKQFLFKENEAAEKIAQLKAQRHEEILRNCLTSLYPILIDEKDADTKQRKQARLFFSRPADKIESFKQRYMSFQSYHYVADMHGITVYDPFTSWFGRKKMAHQIRKEHKKATKQEKQRLVQVEKRLKELNAAQNGLLGQMTAKGWNLITIIDLRNQYDKRIKSLSENDAKSATKRLKTFDDMTREFKDKEIEKLTHALGGLTSLRAASEEIDKLLLQLFDLTNTQKNQLLLQMKEYRLLVQEKDKMTLAKSTRLQLRKAIDI